MPKVSQYLEAALAEAPAIISVVKTAIPAIQDFITQQKTVLSPYVTTIKTDVAALKSASDLMKVPKAIAIAEDVFDVWPLIESAYGEISTLVVSDFTQLKTSVTSVINPVVAPAVTPAIAAPVVPAASQSSI